MSLTTIIVAVVLGALWMLCTYKTVHYLESIPENERTWIDRSTLGRATCAAAGPLFWAIVVLVTIAYALIDEADGYSYVSSDDDEYDGGWYY